MSGWKATAIRGAKTTYTQYRRIAFMVATGPVLAMAVAEWRNVRIFFFFLPGVLIVGRKAQKIGKHFCEALPSRLASY